MPRGVVDSLVSLGKPPSLGIKQNNILKIYKFKSNKFLMIFKSNIYNRFSFLAKVKEIPMLGQGRKKTYYYLKIKKKNCHIKHLSVSIS